MGIQNIQKPTIDYESELRIKKYELIKNRSIERVSLDIKNIDSNKLVNATQSAINLIEKYKYYYESPKNFCSLEEIGSNSLKDLKLQRVFDMIVYSLYSGMNETVLDDAISETIKTGNSAGLYFSYKIRDNNGPKEITEYYNTIFNRDFNFRIAKK
ncbi:MAG: hypothetical protein WC356_00975 [Candidatus Micrarchaeia archaeon]|jgi:hypothetical protein